MKTSRKNLKRVIKEELRLLKEEDYDSYRDARRERGLGGTTWKSKQDYKRRRADNIKRAEEVAAQGKEDALSGRPKDSSISHLAYHKAYDEALLECKERISKRQLRRIVKEEHSMPGLHSISPEQAEEYLRSRADKYRRQGIKGRSMEMLLMDDFMDDLGHQHSAEDYEGYIRELVLGESKMKITKRQLKRIIKEEKTKLISEDAFSDVMNAASQILGPNIELDEEMDGNIIIVADEMDVETNYGQLMAAFPNGEMVEDGFVTGVMQESKITKRQLAKIIREEKRRVLREQRDPRLVQLFMKIGDPIRDEVETLLWDSIGTDSEDVASEVVKAVNTAINDIVMPHLKPGGK